MSTIELKPHSLWPRVEEVTERALAGGTLKSIPTRYRFVEQAGIPFLVRILENLKRKEAAKRGQDRQGPPPNPFLPYDPRLHVTDLGEAHICLLNKFNVVDHHLLVVTREYRDQEELPTGADLAALWAVLEQVDGLAFYNGGPTAGASQGHKHLQLVPHPLSPKGPSIPLEPLLEAALPQGNPVGSAAKLPFVHALGRLDDLGPTPCGEALAERFRALLLKAGLPPLEGRQSGPYNWLATRHWMLVVPRSRESFADISINALGFAGALLVKDEQQLALLEGRGPLTALTEVGLPRS